MMFSLISKDMNMTPLDVSSQEEAVIWLHTNNMALYIEDGKYLKNKKTKCFSHEQERSRRPVYTITAFGTKFTCELNDLSLLKLVHELMEIKLSMVSAQMKFYEHNSYTQDYGYRLDINFLEKELNKLVEETKRIREDDSKCFS